MRAKMLCTYAARVHLVDGGARHLLPSAARKSLKEDRFVFRQHDRSEDAMRAKLLCANTTSMRLVDMGSRRLPTSAARKRRIDDRFVFFYAIVARMRSAQRFYVLTQRGCTSEMWAPDTYALMQYR